MNARFCSTWPVHVQPCFVQRRITEIELISLVISVTRIWKRSLGYSTVWDILLQINSVIRHSYPTEKLILYHHEKFLKVLWAVLQLGAIDAVGHEGHGSITRLRSSWHLHVTDPHEFVSGKHVLAAKLRRISGFVGSCWQRHTCGSLAPYK